MRTCTKTIRLLGVAAVLATGCAGPRVHLGGPMRIAGRVVGAREALVDARVEVRRLDADGISRPVPGQSLRVDETGWFQTDLLGRGWYVLALRSPRLGLSTTSAAVPHGVDAGLVARLVARPRRPGPTVELVPPAGHPGGLHVVATLDTARVPAPERFEARAEAGDVARLGQLAPGLWHLDLPALAITADYLVTSRARGAVRLQVSLPPEGTGSIAGQVIQIDGEPCAGAAVAAYPVPDPASAPASGTLRWARHAVTDSTGSYRIEGLPAGAVRVEVQRRDVLYRILPVPRDVGIPPSGHAEASFVVEP